MALVCKNCGAAATGRYCSQCGQSTSTGRLDMKVILHDLQHGMLHVHNGIFYTLAELFRRPGTTIRSYLDGKRVRHFQPVSMMVVLSAFYAWLNHVGGHDLVAPNGGETSSVAIIRRSIEDHYAISEVLLLPFFALGSLIVFRRRGERFVEWLAFHAFMVSQRTVIQIVTLGLVTVAGTQAEGTIRYGSLVVNAIYMLWAVRQFYAGYPAGSTLLGAVLSIITTVLVAGTILVLSLLAIE